MYKPTVNNINGPVENASSGVLQQAYWSCILYQIPSGITILFTTHTDRRRPPQPRRLPLTQKSRPLSKTHKPAAVLLLLLPRRADPSLVFPGLLT